MTSPNDVIERLIEQLRSDFPSRPDCWQDKAPGWAKDPFNDDCTAKCGYCGSWLEVVRPGKSQCPACGDDFDRANRWKAASALQDNASLIKTLTQAVETEREECAKVADKLGNFGDYTRDELTPFGQARFDMSNEIAAAIRARSTQDKT